MIVSGTATFNQASGGSTVLVRTVPLLNITGGSVVVQGAASHATRQLFSVGGLSLSGVTDAWTGKLDLANNDMIVNLGNLATITNQVAQGFNGGTWQGGGGIVSSAASADSSHLTALGVIQNSVDGTPGGAVLHANFSSASSVASDVLVKFAYFGDTNLDGVVDGSDYSRIDSAVIANQATAGSATGWFNGDFNYDGVIDGSDYTLLDNAFNVQGASLAAAVATPTAQVAGGSSVPEPASIGLVGMAMLRVLGRRRRRVK
jgi:hypothetical protein